MFSRIRMEGYQTLEGRSKSLAIGKTSKPPARRSRARGFVAFFIAAETLQFKRPLASIRLKDGSRELGVYVQERGALDSLVKNPLDWISRSRPAQSCEMNCKKHSLINAFACPLSFVQSTLLMSSSRPTCIPDRPYLCPRLALLLSQLTGSLIRTKRKKQIGSFAPKEKPEEPLPRPALPR